MRYVMLEFAIDASEPLMVSITVEHEDDGGGGFTSEPITFKRKGGLRQRIRRKLPTRHFPSVR